jgi:hypothetical protein
MDSKIKPLRARKIGGSWFLRLSLEFVRANNITEKDFLIVDVSKFKILRPEDFECLGREVKPEPEEVQQAEPEQVS